MRVAVVAVGRLKDAALRAMADDYAGRIRRYVGFDEVELADAPAAKLEPAFARATEGATSVALEVGGRALTSEAFARQLERWGSRGKGNVAFLIGGADGLPPSVSRDAADRLSLSTMTLPHRLARVVLCEQIYRAMTILRGEPYAR